MHKSKTLSKNNKLKTFQTYDFWKALSEALNKEF